MITLKQAGVEDWVQQLEIEQAGKCRFYHSLDTEQEVKKYLAKSKVYFVFDKDKLVGFVSYEIKGDNDFEFDGLVILPQYRGKGYAVKAVQELIKIAGDEKHMWLVTHPQNTAAIIAYLKNGFVVTGWKDNYFGDGEPRIKMERLTK